MPNAASVYASTACCARQARTKIDPVFILVSVRREAFSFVHQRLGNDDHRNNETLFAVFNRKTLPRDKKQRVGNLVKFI